MATFTKLGANKTPLHALQIQVIFQPLTMSLSVWARRACYPSAALKIEREKDIIRQEREMYPELILILAVL